MLLKITIGQSKVNKTDVTSFISDIFEQNLKSVGSSFGFSVYEGIDLTSNRSAVKLNNLWTEFQIEHNFSVAESFMSNDNNPIYSGTVVMQVKQQKSNILFQLSLTK